MKLKNRFATFCASCGNFHPLCIMIPASLLLAALIIRVFSGGTVLIYNAINNTGLFPGPFFYTLGYIIRIILAGVLAALILTAHNLFEIRIKLMILSSVACILLLFEYKLIFISLRALTALILSIICAVIFALVFLRAGRCAKTVFIVCLAALVLQVIFCIQLISLILCI